MRVLLALSIYTNGKKLLATQRTPGSLDCVHGIRFLSMTWVILGHTCLYGVTFGSKYMRQTNQNVFPNWDESLLIISEIELVLNGAPTDVLNLRRSDLFWTVPDACQCKTKALLNVSAIIFDYTK